MPTLGSNTDIQKLYLPSTQDLPDDSPDKAWVEMDVSELVTNDIVDYKPGDGEVMAGLLMLVNRIKNWNYTSQTGEPLPITFDTVKYLDPRDFHFLSEKVSVKDRTLTTEEKKTSLDTSPAEVVL